MPEIIEHEITKLFKIIEIMFIFIFIVHILIRMYINNF